MTNEELYLTLHKMNCAIELLEIAISDSNTENRKVACNAVKATVKEVNYLFKKELNIKYKR
ncbi:hypothetical protein [Paenibacillus polymyxa]|uniref:hypothetical protein n=1 Tax=Paenibacillus polymyxa TaxID=1406 RepID=UPI002AB5B6DC|nr:hypothetical protein [Paenibacillus polymyxa]MDY8021114.1 hypothetical protein [Paenibacillus polymyxa]